MSFFPSASGSSCHPDFRITNSLLCICHSVDHGTQCPFQTSLFKWFFNISKLLEQFLPGTLSRHASFSSSFTTLFVLACLSCPMIPLSLIHPFICCWKRCSFSDLYLLDELKDEISSTKYNFGRTAGRGPALQMCLTMSEWDDSHYSVLTGCLPFQNEPMKTHYVARRLFAYCGVCMERSLAKQDNGNPKMSPQACGDNKIFVCDFQCCYILLTFRFWLTMHHGKRQTFFAWNQITSSGAGQWDLEQCFVPAEDRPSWPSRSWEEASVQTDRWRLLLHI